LKAEENLETFPSRKIRKWPTIFNKIHAKIKNKSG
jgi:hypothetical protein